MKMLTVQDIYTNFIGAYPVDSRSEINVRNSLTFHVGDRKIKLLRGDNAEEFEKGSGYVSDPIRQFRSKYETDQCHCGAHQLVL